MAANQAIDIVNKLRDRCGGVYKRYPSSDRNGTYEEMLEDIGLGQDTSIKDTEEEVNGDDIFEL